MSEQIRRAKLQDLGGITSLVQGASLVEGQADEDRVAEWLYNKGVWVAIRGDAVVGVAAWQAENLLAVTDVFHVAPAEYWREVGSELIRTIEGEAQTLMCEANVVLLPASAPDAARTLLQQHGYQAKPRGDLHRIWREVLSDFAGEELGVMVKQLRDRMVMVPM